MPNALEVEEIAKKIHIIRGHRIMLSSDLAILYRVKTKALIQSVKRNKKRFPPDFMFQLTWNEARSLRSQFVTLDESLDKFGRTPPLGTGKGRHAKYLPFGFTEQGVAMLSSILKSNRAIQANIAIMRIFVKLKHVLAAHVELAQKLNDLERKIENHDSEIRTIFEAIRQLMAPPPEKPKPRIGFRPVP